MAAVGEGLTADEVVLELVASLKSDREEIREQLLKHECRFCWTPFEKLLVEDKSLNPAMCELCADEMKRCDVCGSEECTRTAIEFHKSRDHEWLPVVLFNKTDSEVRDLGAAGVITKSMVSAKAIALTLSSRVIVDMKMVTGGTVACFRGDLVSPYYVHLVALASGRGGLKLMLRLGKFLGFGTSKNLARMGCSARGVGFALVGFCHTMLIDAYDYSRPGGDLKTFLVRCGRNASNAAGVCVGTSYGISFGGTLGAMIGGPVGTAIGLAIGAAVGGAVGHSVTDNAYDLLFGEDEARKDARREAWEELIGKKEKDKKAEMLAKAIAHFSFSAAQIGDPRVFKKKTLKKRFFARAKECHPDMIGGDGAAFIELCTMYGLLLGMFEEKITDTVMERIGNALKKLRKKQMSIEM